MGHDHQVHAQFVGLALQALPGSRCEGQQRRTAPPTDAATEITVSAVRPDEQQVFVASLVRVMLSRPHSCADCAEISRSPPSVCCTTPTMRTADPSRCRGSAKPPALVSIRIWPVSSLITAQHPECGHSWAMVPSMARSGPTSRADLGYSLRSRPPPCRLHRTARSSGGRGISPRPPLALRSQRERPMASGSSGSPPCV